VKLNTGSGLKLLRARYDEGKAEKSFKKFVKIF